jgi:hypothetical protein
LDLRAKLRHFDLRREPPVIGDLEDGQVPSLNFIGKVWNGDVDKHNKEKARGG